MTTNIEWVQNPDGSKGETWPVVTGCTPVGEGCRMCYAARMAATRLKHHPRYEGLATIENGRARWTGEVRLNHDVLEQPLHWKKPRRIFIASMSDLFHHLVPFTFHKELWTVMASCPQHSFQILTKRPRLMQQNVTDLVHRAGFGILPNIWLGVSVENQAAADERREYLKQCPAAVKFVSYEPALSPVDWTGWEFVSQIISGGESGPGARPSHPDWHRATRDFCQANGIAYFFKQVGRWVHTPHDETENSRWVTKTGKVSKSSLILSMNELRGAALMTPVGKKRAGHLLDGCEHQEFPRTP